MAGHNVLDGQFRAGRSQVVIGQISQLPYYEDEIKKLADLSYDDLAAACAKLSVEDVVARHTK